MYILHLINNNFLANCQVFILTLISVCPQKPPVLSWRGAFWATKQSQPFYEGIASLKNRLRQNTPRHDRIGYFRTDTN